MTVDLEEITQRLARVGAAKAVRAERDVAAVEERADLFGVLANVVGRGDDRAACAVQAMFDMCLTRFFRRVQHVPAGRIGAFAGQFGKARAAPQIGLHAPIGLEQIGGGDGFPEDGTGAEQLHARRLAGVGCAAAEEVHALDDVRFDALRHFRMLVVFVHHRQVIEHVFLFDKHAAHAFVHDDGDFVGEGRVIADAVGDQPGKHQRMTVFMLQPFAVKRRASGRAANQEAAGALVAGGPVEIHGALQAEH